MTRRFIPALAALPLALCALPNGRPEPAMAAEPLRAGFAEADITPPLGGSMPGYFKDRQATGVLDPLHAKVLSLRQGDESLALVQLDLVGLGAPVVQRIRDRVTALAREGRSRAPKQVWVHCSHTHTGGMPPRAFTSDADQIFPNLYPGVVDEKWVERLVDSTARAVLDAVKDEKREDSLSLAEGTSRVAFYRRFFMKDGTLRTNPGRNNPEVDRPAGDIDPRVHTLRFEKSRILAVIYGLHPDCVGGTQYSADYPYHMTQALKERLGAEWRVVFWNAACGNINHINVNDPNQKSGPEESQRIGRSLAQSVLDSLPSARKLPLEPFQARTTTVVSRLRRPTEAEIKESEARLAENRNTMEFNGLFAPAVIILAKTKDREHPAEVGALRLGGFGLATVPGEYFVELARQIEGGSPFRPTRTLGLTNGAMGYIPHRDGYRQGGYEAGYRSAKYEPENGHNWAAAAARMLKELEK